MTITCHPAPGRRRLTAGHILASRLSASVDLRKLPPRSAVKTAVMRVGRLLDWPSWAGETLHALLEFCASWNDGGLVVYVSNARLEHEFGIGRRALSARLFRLSELGLIAHRDRPGCHRGRSADGVAYGIDLGPLVALYPRFQHLLDMDARTFSKIRDLRRRLVQRLADIDHLLQTAAASGLSLDDHRHAHLAITALPLSSPFDEERLASELATADRLAAEIEAVLLGATRYDHLGGPLDSIAVESPAPPEAIENHPSHEKPAGPTTPTELANRTICVDEVIATACSASPEIAEALGIHPSRIGPSDFIEGARWMAVSLGVDQGRWAAACHHCGRLAAAFCVAAVLHAQQHRDIRDPVAYFMWSVKRLASHPAAFRELVKRTAKQPKEKAPANGGSSQWTSI